MHGALIPIQSSRDQGFIFSGLNEDAKSWIKDCIEYCQDMDITSPIWILARIKCAL